MTKLILSSELTERRFQSQIIRVVMNMDIHRMTYIHVWISELGHTVDMSMDMCYH